MYRATRKIWPVMLAGLAGCLIWAALEAASATGGEESASLLIPARAKLIISYSRVVVA